MITVRTQGKLYRFPDDTPQDVMKGAIDKHLMSFQSLKGTSTITGKPMQEPPISHEAGQEGYIPKVWEGMKDIAKKVPAIRPETLEPLVNPSALITKPLGQIKQLPKEIMELPEKWEALFPEERMRWIMDLAMMLPQTGMIKGFHGSPYKFTKFDKAKIGTGEGAQAFGHGLYFTSEKDIAKHYATTLSKSGEVSAPYGWRVGNKIIDEADTEFGTILNNFASNVTKQKIINNLDKRIGIWEKTKGAENAVKWAKRAKEFAISINDKVSSWKGADPAANIYSVTIHKGKTPDQYNYLEWDKLVDNKNLSKISKKLDGYPYSTGWESFRDTNLVWEKATPQNVTSEKLYRALSAHLGGQAKASQFLLDAGIDGIKYPAGTLSGQAGKGGYNYVVFDPKAVTIEAINDIPLGKGKQAVPAITAKTDIMHLQADIQRLKTALSKAKTKKASKRINKAIKERETELKELQ